MSKKVFLPIEINKYFWIWFVVPKNIINFTFVVLILEIPKDMFFESYNFDVNEIIRYMQ